MARSRKALVAPAEVEGTPSASAVSCLAVGQAILADGTRTVPGQWYEVTGEAAQYWYGRGVLLSQAQIDALWFGDGRILSPIPTQYRPHNGGQKLRVLQLTHYDPGSSVYRYHSAANTVPGVVSAFARLGHSNPHCDLRQWDVRDDIATVRILAATADVIHCHIDYTVAVEELGGIRTRSAITYHGSVEQCRPSITFPDVDASLGSVVFGARPYHTARFGAQWLPIPMPCKDYAALAKGRTRGDVLRVCHSPTRPEIKGTDVFLAAVDQLRSQGVAIEAVLVAGMSHAQALTVKATCDVTFDSFWLGMQGSGLEAAAMGQPVVAGTQDAPYDAVGIPYPWTVANDLHDLMAVLRRLATDADYYAAEAKRVGAYVRAEHDYIVVGTKYVDALTETRDGAADAA
jgi:hypothetical protein